ncbi:MAG: hypothetical protein AB7L71_12800 [Vicinamibacterales bacterium]
MDDSIFEEFKGTGNMEIHLDRKLVEGAAPARKSCCTPRKGLNRIWVLRRVLKKFADFGGRSHRQEYWSEARDR